MLKMIPKKNTKQKGAKRYLGGQRNNEAQRSDVTPCNRDA
jgi:hypothetical protein